MNNKNHVKVQNVIQLKNRYCDYKLEDYFFYCSKITILNNINHIKLLTFFRSKFIIICIIILLCLNDILPILNYNFTTINNNSISVLVIIRV